MSRASSLPSAGGASFLRRPTRRGDPLRAAAPSALLTCPAPPSCHRPPPHWTRWTSAACPPWRSSRRSCTESSCPPGGSPFCRRTAWRPAARRAQHNHPPHSHATLPNRARYRPTARMSDPHSAAAPARAHTALFAALAVAAARRRPSTDSSLGLLRAPRRRAPTGRGRHGRCSRPRTERREPERAAERSRSRRRPVAPVDVLPARRAREGGAQSGAVRLEGVCGMMRQRVLPTARALRHRWSP